MRLLLILLVGLCSSVRLAEGVDEHGRLRRRCKPRRPVCV